MAIEIIGMVGTQDVSESRGSPGGPAIDPGYLTRFAQAHELAGGGRVAIHHISGGDEADQQRDGDFTGHDRRYARTAEFMSVLRRELTAAEPFDHDGEFYRVRGAYSDVKPVPRPGSRCTSAGPRPPRPAWEPSTPTSTCCGASRWRRSPSGSPRCGSRPRAGPRSRAC